MLTVLIYLVLIEPDIDIRIFSHFALQNFNLLIPKCKILNMLNKWPVFIFTFGENTDRAQNPYEKVAILTQLFLLL